MQPFAEVSQLENLKQKILTMFSLKAIDQRVNEQGIPSGHAHSLN